MRKVTKQAIEAFKNGEPFKSSNTVVKTTRLGDGTLNVGLYLFGNLIARTLNGRLEITLAGWKTATTKERLNGLDGVYIQKKQGYFYLNGQLWSGEWTSIS